MVLFRVESVCSFLRAFQATIFLLVLPGVSSALFASRNRFPDHIPSCVLGRGQKDFVAWYVLTLLSV